MIQDIIKIREELDGFIEVEYPYEFQKGCLIKYITHKKNLEEESFYPGGSFISYGDNYILLRNKKSTWSVPIYKKNKNGDILYKTRFFILENNTEKINQSKEELYKTILFQQNIIETMKERLKEVEIQKQSLYEDKCTYEELLQKNRYILKDLSIKQREHLQEIDNLKDKIQKLSQSHPLMK